jgi:ACT domain-containing protein
MEQESGTRRTVWLPRKLEKKVEEVRKALGLSKSAFYRFAIVEIVKQFQTKQFKPKESRK